jgi:hypothetical protein
MDPNENRRLFHRAYGDISARKSLNAALRAWLRAGGFPPSVDFTATKVRMRTGRDSCSYAVDGRYFGKGTRNFDCVCHGCGVSAAIGAGSRPMALHKFAPNCRCGK